MIKIHFACFALLLCAAVLAQKAPVLLEAGKIINPVICEGDASQSYAAYIPARGNKEALPVVYLFDPHGDGALPLAKYKSLADEYGFILIGSNNSKNGNDWAVTGHIWQQLFRDTQKKLKINSARIYACGFSGGAKVAGYVALNYPGVKGVIANSAGLPDGAPVGNFAFTFTGIAGEGDMNMADVAAFNKELDNTTTRHRMIIFDGKHEWAPAATMATAFAGLELDAMRQGILKNDAFISRFVEQGKQKVNTLIQSNQLIKAAQECSVSVSMLDGVSNEAGWFKQQAASIANNSVYKKEQQAQQTILAKEQDMKAGYIQQFQQGDMAYWQKTIASLKTAAAAKTAESMMDQRLLAWLSLAFYSISNQLINANNNAQARHFVDLYKLADPTNSEAWYFSAILNARGQQAQAAQSDLLKAASLGFTDKAQMEQQPEFKKLSINLAGIESKMGGPQLH